MPAGLSWKSPAFIINFRRGIFLKDHRDKTEVPDPLVVSLYCVISLANFRLILSIYVFISEGMIMIVIALHVKLPSLDSYKDARDRAEELCTPINDFTMTKSKKDKTPEVSTKRKAAVAGRAFLKRVTSSDDDKSSKLVVSDINAYNASHSQDHDSRVLQHSRTPLI